MVDSTNVVVFERSSDGRYVGDVAVSNVGLGPVRLNGVVSGCRCTSAELTRTSLNPGEHCNLRLFVEPSESGTGLNYDPTQGIVRFRPDVTIHGEFHTSEGLRDRLSVVVAGISRMPVRIPSALDLGTFGPTRESFTVSRAIEALFPVDQLRNGSAYVRCPGVEIGVELPDAPLDEQSRIILHFHIDPVKVALQYPDRERFSLDAALTLSFLDGRTESFTLPAELTLVPEVSVRPARIVVGPIASGESVERHVKFYSNRTDGGPVEAVAVEPFHPNVEIVDQAMSSDAVSTTLRIRATDAMPRVSFIPFRVQRSRSPPVDSLRVPFILVVR